MSAFVEQLAPKNQVVLHGWSMGGLVAVLAAGLIPDRIRGVVLAAPTLPRHLTSPVEALGWQTLGRLALAASPPAIRVALRLAGRRVLDAKQASITDAVSRGRASLVGGDPSRVCGAQIDLWLDDLQEANEHPDRLAGSATAFASTTKTMFIAQGPTNAALDALPVPVLLLWGTDDPLVDATSLLQHAQRPGWTPRPIEEVGHLLPVEEPEIYAHEVRQFLPSSRGTSGLGRPHRRASAK